MCQRVLKCLPSPSDLQRECVNGLVGAIGYDPKFGARPLKRIIQSKILTPVASMMVGEGMLRGGTVHVSLKKDQLSFDISKKGGHKVISQRPKKKAAATV